MVRVRAIGPRSIGWPTGRSGRAFRRRIRRWSSFLGAGLVLAALPVLGIVAWLGSRSEPPDPGAELAQSLVYEGHAEEVISCVTRLAADDLELGPLSALDRDELIAGCRAARAALEPPPPQEPAPSIDQPSEFGDDPVLDQLWVACEDGLGSACDDLFGQAPLDSEYERFGLTCGDRPAVLRCSELDASPDGDPDAGGDG